MSNLKKSLSLWLCMLLLLCSNITVFASNTVSPPDAGTVSGGDIITTDKITDYGFENVPAFGDNLFSPYNFTKASDGSIVFNASDDPSKISFFLQYHCDTGYKLILYTPEYTDELGGDSFDGSKGKFEFFKTEDLVNAEGLKYTQGSRYRLAFTPNAGCIRYCLAESSVIQDGCYLNININPERKDTIDERNDSWERSYMLVYPADAKEVGDILGVIKLSDYGRHMSWSYPDLKPLESDNNASASSEVISYKKNAAGLQYLANVKFKYNMGTLTNPNYEDKKVDEVCQKIIVKEPDGSVFCELDGASNSAEFETALRIEVNGVYTVEYVGLYSSITSTFEVTGMYETKEHNLAQIDKTKPTVSVSGIPDSISFGESFDVKLTTNVDCIIYLNGVSINGNTYTKSGSYEITDNGTYMYEVVSKGYQRTYGEIKVDCFKENKLDSASYNPKLVATVFQNLAQTGTSSIVLIVCAVVFCVVGAILLLRGKRKESVSNEKN